MSDDAEELDAARAHWTRLCEADISRVVIEAFRAGARWERARYDAWLSARPGGERPPGIGGAADPAEQASTAAGGSPPPSSSASSPPKPSSIPHKGPTASTIALEEIAAALPERLTSKELLAKFRARDGRPKSDQRDNTFLKAVRRLKDKGTITLVDGRYVRVGG